MCIHIVYTSIFQLLCENCFYSCKYSFQQEKQTNFWVDHRAKWVFSEDFFYLWQKQQTQLQEVLRRLSLQQNVESKETQQSPRQQLSREPSEHSAFIQLQQKVAEKEAKIKELEEEIQQLSVKVKKEKSWEWHLNSTKIWDEK